MALDATAPAARTWPTSLRLLSPAQDSNTHVRSVEFFCHSRAWLPREESRIPLEDVGPGFFARQPRARIDRARDRARPDCHYDLQSSIVRFDPSEQHPVAPSSIGAVSVGTPCANPVQLQTSRQGRRREWHPWRETVRRRARESFRYSTRLPPHGSLPVYAVGRPSSEFLITFNLPPPPCIHTPHTTNYRLYVGAQRGPTRGND